MQIGKVYLYRKTKKSRPRAVLIAGGVNEVDGRVSNFWSFKYISKTGLVEDVTHGDYNNGWRYSKFVEVSPESYTVSTVVVIKGE